MDDQIGPIAMSVLALCVVGLITFQIWSHKTGRIKPRKPKPGSIIIKPGWIVACVVVWLIVAIPLINMYLPEITHDRPVVALCVLFPVIAFLGLWYGSHYDLGGGGGYTGD